MCVINLVCPINIINVKKSSINMNSYFRKLLKNQASLVITSSSDKNAQKSR